MRKLTDKIQHQYMEIDSGGEFEAQTALGSNPLLKTQLGMGGTTPKVPKVPKAGLGTLEGFSNGMKGLNAGMMTLSALNNWNLGKDTFHNNSITAKNNAITTIANFNNRYQALRDANKNDLVKQLNQAGFGGVSVAGLKNKKAGLDTQISGYEAQAKAGTLSADDKLKLDSMRADANSMNDTISQFGSGGGQDTVTTVAEKMKTSGAAGINTDYKTDSKGIFS